MKSGITGDSDSSYAPEIGDRRSQSSYVFLRNGGAISWKTKRQPITALSSMEAEYIGLTCAVKEALWLQKIVRDVENKNSPMIIFEDNQAAIKTAHNSL